MQLIPASNVHAERDGSRLGALEVVCHAIEVGERLVDGAWLLEAFCEGGLDESVFVFEEDHLVWEGEK